MFLVMLSAETFSDRQWFQPYCFSSLPYIRSTRCLVSGAWEKYFHFGRFTLPAQGLNSDHSFIKTVRNLTHQGQAGRRGKLQTPTDLVPIGAHSPALPCPTDVLGFTSPTGHRTWAFEEHGYGPGMLQGINSVSPHPFLTAMFSQTCLLIPLQLTL